MKRALVYSFIWASALATAQDKVYLMDGSRCLGKVTEITPHEIIVRLENEEEAPNSDGTKNFFREEVVLIEYKNGSVEVYNQPERSLVYNANGTVRGDAKSEGQDFVFNMASLNTLALCNTDLAGFFERLIQSRQFGFGFMGAYNFNQYAVAPNTFIAVLYNAKKNYDIGAFVNFYPGRFKRRTTFYMGTLFKYTSFSFSKVIEERNGPAVNIRYSPAKGSQMATLITLGSHSKIGKNFFFKTIAGLGGFTLRGDYKQQFNYILNKNRRAGDPVLNYGFLPKFYFGINLGFSF